MTSFKLFLSVSVHKAFVNASHPRVTVRIITHFGGGGSVVEWLLPVILYYISFVRNKSFPNANTYLLTLISMCFPSTDGETHGS